MLSETDVPETMSSTLAAKFLEVGKPRLLQLDERLAPERNERGHRVYRRDALERYQREREPWNMAARLDELRKAAAVKGPAFEREFMADLEQRFASLSEGGRRGRVDGHLNSTAPQWELEAMVDHVIDAGNRAEHATRYNLTGRADASPDVPAFSWPAVVWPEEFDRAKAIKVLTTGGADMIIALNKAGLSHDISQASDAWIKGALDRVLNSQWNTERLEELMQASGYEPSAVGWCRRASQSSAPARTDATGLVNVTERDRREAALRTMAHSESEGYPAIVEAMAKKIALTRAGRR